MVPPGDGTADDRLMAEVEAVEIAERNDGAASDFFGSRRPCDKLRAGFGRG
jgi:hypothetical protein